MDWKELALKNLHHLPPRAVGWIEKRLKKIPSFQRQIEEEYGSIMTDLENSLKPYKTRFETYRVLPEVGVERDQVLYEMEALREK
ncbi:MAG: hypothetical protein FJZ87_07940, partial [Chloroflexi bacterium]|nr:hypothetical protein [Chloroflexota bacterium]